MFEPFNDRTVCSVKEERVGGDTPQRAEVRVEPVAAAEGLKPPHIVYLK